MNLDLELLKPPKRLAIAYARRPEKGLLSLLLLMDARLGEILKHNSEPLIAQMRLAWWRDVIGKVPAQRPSGEPLIAQLNLLQAAHPEWNIDEFLLSIIDGWDELFANESWNNDALVRHGKARSKGIFASFAVISGYEITEGINTLGQRWALTDLLAFCQNEEQYRAVIEVAFPEVGEKRKEHLPRRLRPLTILSLASNDGVSATTLFWHALTGR
jgi:15-cis-phytoene synthase